ncbi:MAG: NADPH:quinone oxidoreductase family protein [Acidimicrobiales bacterium]
MSRLEHLAHAWRVRQLGAPGDALSWELATVRSPGPGEALVAVEAVGLNFPDLLVCAGRYQERPQLPFTPGFEAVGTVVEAGPGAALAPGARVAVIPELPEGAMQERLTVARSQLFPIPGDMPLATAAVLAIAYQTSHVALFRRGGLEPGEWVLVTGAAGGVGMAALQLAVAAGARVVAVVNGGAKAAACVRWGAEAVLDRSDPTLAAGGAEALIERVRDHTDGRGAQLAVDVVGGDLFHILRRCVAFEGRIVVVGFTSGSVPSVPANHVLLRNYSLMGLHLARYRSQEPTVLHEAHADLVRRWRRQEIAPEIHAELPIEQAPEALELLSKREVVGRVVLRTGS